MPYPITQNYGVNGEQGVDIGTPFGTPVALPYSGTISKLGYYGWGGEVDVQSTIPGLGNVQQYVLHLDQIANGLGVGSTIQAGQNIGISGGQNYGGNHPAQAQFSSGPHIEYGIKTPNGGTVNPLTVLGTGSNSSNNNDPFWFLDPYQVGQHAVPIAQNIPVVSGAIQAANGAGQTAVSVASFLTNPVPALSGLGKRIGLFTLGLLLAALGFVLLAWTPITNTAKTAIKAAPFAAAE